MKNILSKIPQPLAEAIKEGARLAIIAGVSFLISFGVKYVAGLPETQTTLILTFVLKSLDKWLHESGKAQEADKNAPSMKTGGLTRF